MSEDSGVSMRQRGVGLDRPNLKELVADQVRSDIFAGRMRPGSHIDQDGIASALGISRLPVREALIALEREGIVQISPRRGAFVWNFTADDMKDHYAIYADISRMATERAAQHLADSQVRLLGENVESMRKETDRAELERLNDRFHAAVNRGSESRRMMWLLGLMSTSMPADYDAAGWRSATSHHQVILDRIVERDSVGAGEAMYAHLVESGEMALKSLQASGLWG